MLITSKENEKVKFIKSLNEKKSREINNAYYLEGLKVTYEILENKEAVNVMFIAYSSEILSKINHGNIDVKKLIKKCEEKNIKTYEIKENVFKYMCDTVTPQGILCVLKKEEKNLEEQIIKNIDRNIFILDSVQDLGNIGTIIRNAVAFNIKNIICLNNTADIYCPKALRSTMGAINKVNIFYEKNFEIIEKLKQSGYQIVVTALKDSTNLKDFDFSKKSAFVFRK